MSITYRSPEFEQLREYLIKMYGMVQGVKYYQEWLDRYGLDESVPLMFQKKLKSTKTRKEEELDVILKMIDEGAKLKSSAIGHLWKRTRQKIIETAMRLNDADLYKFAKRVQNADPEFQRQKKRERDQVLLAEAEMLAHAIGRAGDNPEQALKNFDSFMKRSANRRKKLSDELLDEDWKKQLKKA